MSSLTKMKTWREILRRPTTEPSRHRRFVDVLYELPNGAQDHFTLIEAHTVVSCLAVTADQKIILARQFRPGPQIILDELPGGHVDSGELPLQAAQRELLEETGYSSSEWKALPVHSIGPYVTSSRYGFLAINCKKTAAPQLDPTEFIEVIEKPIPEFLAQLQAAQISDQGVAWRGLWELGQIISRN